MIVCDTHVLVFDALSPDLLGSAAAQAIQESHDTGSLACADISLWEIAMLIEKGRLEVDASIENFLNAVISARRLSVLPVTPSIAALSVSSSVPEGDPADRLIAATAISHGATLITKDERLIGFPNLPTIW